MKRPPAGFTLIEMLVTLVIVAALSTLTFVGLNCARHRARTAVELHAARNLITGYLNHAAENNGRVLAGYQTDPATTNLDGKLLEFPVNARYPWRLASSVPAVKGVLVFNATIVGGHFGSGSPLPPTPRIVEAYGKFHLTHLTESDDPGKLIVFASARSGEGMPGYYEVRPPRLTGPVWSSEEFADRSPASAHGFVDFRWRGKAVAAMLGGNVELPLVAPGGPRERPGFHHPAGAMSPTVVAIVSDVENSPCGLPVRH
jgi:prepilin-type N-terminal cleavage/methylation domain-containing protein